MAPKASSKIRKKVLPFKKPNNCIMIRDKFIKRKFDKDIIF